MERAARSLAKLKSKHLPLTDLACAAWPQAVGPRLARRTRAVEMVRGTVIVEVEDRLWQKNLFGLRHQILANLSRLIGPVATDVEFRIGIPRRPAQREEKAATQMGLLPADEADRIADPILRHLYLRSRRSALG
ncbi:MAG: DciA family protein [Acidobacteria bacterium]|nr:DciA family protein [Acidobacteriota bacterium]